jgi:1-deoxy-D-xylulose-5-phosphate synthase
MTALEIGRAAKIRQGSGVAILNFGILLDQVVEVAQQLDATILDMRWVKPLDEEAIIAAASTHDLVVTVEENAVAGGAGSGVAALIADSGLDTPTLQLGIPDGFVEHGSQAEQRAWTGLDAAGILGSIEKRMSRLPAHPKAPLESLGQSVEASR